MTKTKQKPDTQFRKCTGCNSKVWCERPTLCPECVAFFAWYFGPERSRLDAVPPRSPYGAAYERGAGLSANLKTFRAA